MKKYLVFSVIFLTSFLLISNVKASTTEITLNTAIDQEELLNNFFVTKEEIGIDETVFQNAINSFNIDTDKYDYIISYRKNSSTSIYLYCWKWEKTSTFKAEPSISFLDYTGNQNMYWFNFVVRFSSGKSYELSYDIYNDKKGSSFNYISIENNIIGFNYDSNKKLKYMRSVYRILETSIDLKMGTSALYDYNTNSYNPKRISNFMIDDGELCYSIKKGDILFDKDLTPSWVTPKIPEITFKEVEKGYEDETKTKLLFHKIGINFSIYDTDKYIYFYRTSLQNDKTWNSISNNDFEYTAFSDQTLYVAVIDRQKYEESAENGQELVFDYIATATYTFDKLSSTIPELSFNANTPDSCYMTINGKKETVCKNLNIKISNYNDLNKYLWEYSIGNSENFKPTYSDKFTLYLDDNVTIYFRLLDREKNEYIKYATYKMAGISQNISSIGPYVNLHGEYKEKEYYYEVTVYYYNYDSNLYNYYYSVDREKWTEINPIDLSIYSSNSTNKTYYNQYKVYQDCTFYLKIEDKNGNFVKAATLTIDSFGKNNTPKNILQNIKSIFDGKTGIFNKVNEIYSIIRNSKVGIYIFIVISGSIIILLIKGIRS